MYIWAGHFLSIEAEFCFNFFSKFRNNKICDNRIMRLYYYVIRVCMGTSSIINPSVGGGLQ